MIDRIVVWALSLKAKLGSERGQDVMEYALLGGLIAVAIIVAAGLLGTNLSTWFDEMADKIGTLGP